MTGTAARADAAARGRRPPGLQRGAGEITRAVQREFEDALHGRSERYAEWLDVVEASAPASAT
jgi:branched-chain amino acid aminotransferase